MSTVELNCANLAWHLKHSVYYQLDTVVYKAAVVNVFVAFKSGMISNNAWDPVANFVCGCSAAQVA